METKVIRAQAGNRQALETIVEGIQGKVYELALRMLGHPSDAEDAAQEILIKVITRMGSFRGESAFYTWVYRIATLFDTYPPRRPPEAFAPMVKRLLATPGQP